MTKLHCLVCFKPIDEPVWDNNWPKCKECATDLDKGTDKPKDDTPIVTVSPNSKCTNCWGRGQVKTQMTKPPGNMKNVNMGKGAKIVVNQWCGCVLKAANKVAKTLGLEEGVAYNIKLKGK